MAAHASTHRCIAANTCKATTTARTRLPKSSPTDLVLGFVDHGLGGLNVVQALLVVQDALLHGAAVQLAGLALAAAAARPRPRPLDEAPPAARVG